MTTYYSKITSKGQITVPVAIRRALKLSLGDQVRVSLQGDKAVLEAGGDIAGLRSRIQAEARERGTWGVAPAGGDGWAKHVADDLAKP